MCRRRLESIAVRMAVLTVVVALLPGRASAKDPAKAEPVDLTGDDDSNPHPVLPNRPGDYRLKYKTHIGDRPVEMPYVLRLPPHYNNDPHAKHPVLVFFHGIGERGTDLGGVYALGPLPLLNSNAAFAATFPYILICPQCSPEATWDTDYMYKTAAKLIELVVRNTRADPDRVYATGLSMGGLGSWCVAEEAPDLFAAIAPTSAMAWHPEQAAEKLRYVSVWSVSGVNDQPRFIDGARAMDAALAHNPLHARFTYFVDKGHEAWYPPFQSIGFYEWFLSHRKLSPAQRKKLDAQAAPLTNQPLTTQPLTTQPLSTQPLPTAPLPTAPGHYFLSFPIMMGNQPFNMDYLLYLPKGYKPNSPPSPAMLFLSEQEGIGPVYHDLCVHGPDLELEKRPGLQNNFPFVVISPRAPIDCDWNRPGMTKALLDLLDHVGQGIGIDPDRITVTGLNAGADGAWKLAAEAPDRFAAIAPVVTAGPFNPPDDRATVIKSIPGRVFVKPDDNATANRMNQLIKGTPLDWRISKLPITAAATVDIPAYSDHQFLAWLLQQHRAPNSISTATEK